MKWKLKTTDEEKGYRIRHRFLFFPKRIGDEWRWLEFATYKERWSLEWEDIDQNPSTGWYPYCWIDQ
jgi:hypothetical protein